MFDYLINLAKKEIKHLESAHKTEGEIFLGVSALNEEAKASLKNLGWRILYVEQGTFLLSKL